MGRTKAASKQPASKTPQNTLVHVHISNRDSFKWCNEPPTPKKRIRGTKEQNLCNWLVLTVSPESALELVLDTHWMTLLVAFNTVVATDKQ